MSPPGESSHAVLNVAEPPASIALHSEEEAVSAHPRTSTAVAVVEDVHPPPNPIHLGEPGLEYSIPPQHDKARQILYSASTSAVYPPILLETAANAAAANSEDSVALAAMQEAATIVMQAHERMQYEQPYTYADANAIIRTDEMGGMLLKRALSGDATKGQRKKPRGPPAPRVAWEERLKQLEAYRTEHGDLLVPTRYKGYMNLGKYVHNMREQYKVFHRQDYPKKCGLTDARIQQLEDMGFQWTTKRHMKQEDEWGKRFGQLESFKAEHGHCNVPSGYQPDPAFAEWIHRQRTTYHFMKKDKAQGKVVNRTMEDRFEKLRHIGFLFQVQSNKWMDHWRQLKTYREANADCLVPTHYAENPTLGRWVHTQRHQRRLQEKGRKS
jgi:Helicase associated domain